MNKEKVHVVLASDANYLPGLTVTQVSMIAACADPSRLAFHVFDGSALASCDVADMPQWNGSRMTYLRLWLPRLLPDVDRVVYSDVDTIWNRDICELWDVTAPDPQSPNATPSLSWVRDKASMRRATSAWIERVAADEGFHFDWARYGCAGICVMNLSKMREMNLTQRVLGLFAKYGGAPYVDQDMLNAIFNRDCRMLPVVWNVMGDCHQLPPEGEPCVYHLTGVGRHFNDATPPVYPPQYQYWWNVYKGTHDVHPRSRLLARLWPLRGLTCLLWGKLRERIVCQLFFARVLVRG